MTRWDEQVLAAANWWQAMMSSPRGDNRAAIARLRQARTPMEAFMVPATLDLIRRLKVNRDNIDRVAILASVLAHLKPDFRETKSIGRSLGRSKINEPESAVLSETRFQRLLQAEDDELLDQFRRAVRLLKGAANPESIARTILFWNDRTRKDLIFDYYNVSFDVEDQSDRPSQGSV